MLFFTSKQNTVPEVTFLGDVKVPAPTNHFRRKPVEYILYVVTSGRMLLVEDDTTYDLMQGDYILLSVDHTHHGLPLDSPVEYFFVHFLWEDFNEIELTQTTYENELLKSMMKGEDSIFLLPKFGHISGGLSLITSIYRELCTEQKAKNHYYSYSLSCLFTGMLVNINRVNSINTLRDDLVMRLLGFLQANSCENITSSDIENNFHLNFDYLNRRFKQQSGETIMHYHNECRINEAKKLLNSGLYSVAEVAEKLHYCNEFYFSRAFKKHTGTAPSRFAR